MKKFIPLMIMLLVFSFSVSASAPFAPNGTAGGDTGTDASAYSKVTLNLKSSDNAVVEVWFDEDGSATRLPESTKTEVTLAKDGDEYSNATDPLYANWYIKSGAKFNVTLKIEQALTGTVSDDTIAWGVTGTNIDIDSTNNASKVIVEHDGTSLETQDRVQLILKTEQQDYSEITPDTYTAYLSLTVSTV